MRYSLATLAIFLLTTTGLGAVEIPDSGLVRIRLDQDNAVISIDGTVQSTDRKGNAPTKHVWFILPMAQGVHTLTLSKAGYRPIEQSVTVGPKEVATVDVSFQPETAGNSSSAISFDSTKFAEVHVFSDPAGAKLRLDDAKQTIELPAQLTLAGGEHTLEVSSTGYEELTQQLMLNSGEIISLRFLLRENQPFPISAEELGLEFQTEIPLIDEKVADKLRQQFYGFAETFAIIPLTQGIIARLIVGEDSKYEANALIIAGVGLTGGSYLLGRILSSRKRSQIIQHNERAAQENLLAKKYNQDINRIIREKNAEAIDDWEQKNRRRGRVEILNK